MQTETAVSVHGLSVRGLLQTVRQWPVSVHGLSVRGLLQTVRQWPVSRGLAVSQGVVTDSQTVHGLLTVRGLAVSQGVVIQTVRQWPVTVVCQSWGSYRQSDSGLFPCMVCQSGGCYRQSDSGLFPCMVCQSGGCYRQSDSGLLPWSVSQGVVTDNQTWGSYSQSGGCHRQPDAGLLQTVRQWPVVVGLEAYYYREVSCTASGVILIFPETCWRGAGVGPVSRTDKHGYVVLL